MPEVFTHNEQIIEIGSEWLARLKTAAEASPLRRARLCLHLRPDDAVQEMILALCRDTLFRPHRHPNKTESFHIIEGELDLIIFDDAGRPKRVIRMGPPGAAGKTFCYRLNTPLYHTVLPQTQLVLFHETTTGPFVNGDAQFAPWAPTDLVELRAFVDNALRTLGSQTPTVSA